MDVDDLYPAPETAAALGVSGLQTADRLNG